MSYLFVGNSVTDFQTTAVQSTDAAGFDPLFSSDAMKIVHIGPGAMPTIFDIPAPVGAMWFRMLYTWPEYQSGFQQDGTLVEFKDENGVVIAFVDILDSNIYANVMTANDIDNRHFWPEQTQQFLDCKLTWGASVTLEVFVGGVPVSAKTTASPASVLPPRRVNIKLEDVTERNDGISASYISEVICMDGEDTRNMRLATLRPDSAGAYSDWTGGFAELGDLSVLTVASHNINNQRVSSNVEAYNGPAMPTGIRALVVNSSVQKAEPGGPQNVQQFVRTAATDYDSATIHPGGDGGFAAISDVWDINPNTGLPWATADLASLEIGLQTKA